MSTGLGRIIKIGLYTSLAVTLVYLVIGFLFDDQWSQPLLSIENFSGILGLIVPLVGSISTLFGAVAIWSWAISKQSKQRGMDDLAEAGIGLRRLADMFVANRKDVQPSDIGVVGRFVDTCMKFQAKLTYVTPSGDATEVLGRLENELGEFTKTREKTESRLDGMMRHPRWISMFGDAEIFEIRVNRGLDELLSAFVYKHMTGQLFRSVAYGLTTTVAFALLHATVLILAEQPALQVFDNDHWLLVPLVSVVLIGTLFAVAKPALVLRDLWVGTE